MKDELRRLLSTLICGTRKEFKEAKREIARLWNHEPKKFISSATVALEFIPRFNQIVKVENKEAFASSLSFFFLALADEYFKILKNFTLEVIQHPDGHVREAIRKTADWLFASLTSRADPFVYPKGKELTDKQKAEKIKSREEYLDFVKEIEMFIERYDVEDENVEYVDEMKPSVNKSLQQLWNRLTEGRVYQEILEATRPIPYEIFMKRKEVEQELVKMLEETGSDFDLRDVKDIIYNEDGQDSLTGVIRMFDTGRGVTELQNVLDLANDAWNYFPHKILGGLSPAEKVMECRPKGLI